MRRKLEDKLLLPVFPTISSLPQWKIDVGKNLATYGGYTDQAELKWIAEVWATGQTFDALAESGLKRFHYMDLKLSTVLVLMVKSTQSAR